MVPQLNVRFARSFVFNSYVLSFVCHSNTPKKRRGY